MALADTGEPVGRTRRSSGWRGAVALAPAAVPPPALVLLGTVSVQVGAGVAKHLFDVLPPSTVVSMRMVVSAVVLGVLARGVLRGVFRDHSRRDLAVAVGFGLTLAAMNLSFYQAISRIPLGAAVTVEFLGPLCVSIVASRRRLDLVWAVLAFGGVVLLTGGGDGSVTLAGVGFALLAGTGWACYIMVGAATGRRFPGTSGLAIASIVGTLIMAPVGVGAAGTRLADPEALALGAAVGLLSSVIPYSLELEALRRLPARVFGILMSLDPAVAALVGLVLLDEMLSPSEWAAVGCVILACAGATYGQKDPPETPEA